MKKSVFIFTFIFVFVMGFAQTNTTPKYNVPEEYSFLLREDYNKYEPEIKEAIDWYLWRSMGMDNDKRQNAATFFMQWLVGSPAVTVEVDTKVVNFVDTNPQLLIPFSMGWSKYAIENENADRIKASAAGIEAAVTYYNKNRAFMNKDANIEKYEKMIKNKKLENYISKNLPPKK
ncbi:hypothetical protein G7051_07090 [Dysgonomonas sp. HDW5B]|uniref:hypothetical protein n=1 Tax=Dysgonomonas sp. HDW5B TaxID=2714927 RepID=UPI00140E6DF4|nr:hypothetical protein [Dysgonomonas sp. HDW5B]QIK54111.1 hypothetical protein G7051_07090 [Dysgonomonas sp. HDW5B]